MIQLRKHPLRKACPKSGPWAKSGPPQNFVRPTAELNLWSESGLRGARCLKTNVLTLTWASGPWHAPQERKRRSCVGTIDIIYICSCICVYNLFGRNSNPSFSLLWSVQRAGVSCKSEYFFFETPGPPQMFISPHVALLAKSLDTPALSNGYS